MILRAAVSPVYYIIARRLTNLSVAMNPPALNAAPAASVFGLAEPTASLMSPGITHAATTQPDDGVSTTDVGKRYNKNNRLARKHRRREQQQKRVEETGETPTTEANKRLRLDNTIDDAESVRRGSHYYAELLPSVYDNIDNIHYYTSNGLLRVRPYDYTWCAFAKTRWQDRPIRSIFEDEFSSPSEHVQRERLRQFRVRVNSRPVADDYIVKGGDFIQHDIHRHEAPVLERACNIPIVYEDEQTLVVNKPSSVPVHPCGRHFYNTLLGVLARFSNKRDLKITHRLDKATSGICIFAKTSEKAAQIGREHMQQLWQKEYVCRVRGDFPDGTITCSEPIACVDKKQALYLCRGGADTKDAKTATTIFEKLHATRSPTTGQVESVVIAKPITGRTHQIRVHLLHLGHPIVNDPLYGRKEFAATSADGTKFTDEQYQAAIQAGALEHNHPKFMLRLEKPENAKDLDFHEDCPECWLEFVDPKEENMVMYLHAYRYRYVGEDTAGVIGSDRREYATEMPDWAKE